MESTSCAAPLPFRVVPCFLRWVFGTFHHAMSRRVYQGLRAHGFFSSPRELTACRFAVTLRVLLDILSFSALTTFLPLVVIPFPLS